jgi:zinc-binding alcohol dehydrogenase/oxidoreductase
VTFDNRLLFAKQISVFGSTMGSKQDFIDAMQFLWTRGIKPIIDRIAPLSDGIKMIEHLESGNQFGKIVLKPS